MNENILPTNNKNSFQILLVISVLALSLLNIFLYSNRTITETTTVADKTFEVEIYVEGENSSLARVSDISIDYDRDTLSLVSSDAGGFLEGSSVITKDGWSDGRFLLISNTVDVSKPLVRLKFRTKKVVEPPQVRVSADSKVYLSQKGDIPVPVGDVTYRINYQ